MPKSKVFGMVTTSKSASYTPHALSSFFEHTTLESGDQFLLIDNNGDYDATQLVTHPLVDLCRNEQPRSFAANMNQALDLAMAKQADLYFLNNDLIFSAGWIEPLLLDQPEILSPLSNREVQFQTNDFVTTMSMMLADYLGQEKEFQVLASEYRKQANGYYNVAVLPFFCVKVPYSILKVVGRLDESFGKGGAEDYDYCLRAILAGFKIKYALTSYVLHFGGKSSWSGAETRAEQDERELLFRTMFAIKWGEALLRLFFFEDSTVLDAYPELKGEVERGNHKKIVQALMSPVAALAETTTTLASGG